MLDITAVPTRSVNCPFPLISFDPAEDEGAFSLFVGRDRAAVVSLHPGHASLCRFVSQPHRELTSGACRPDIGLIALGDATGSVTLHRADASHSRSETVFLCDPSSPAGVAQLAAVWHSSEADFVCAPFGGGAVWAVGAARGKGRPLCEASRLFSLSGGAMPKCFAASAPIGAAVRCAASGETLFRLEAPEGAGEMCALRAGGERMLAALTDGGTAALYDARRPGRPVWAAPLSAHDARQNGDSGMDPTPQWTPLLVSSGCGPAENGGGAWAALVGRQFHFIRAAGAVKETNSHRITAVGNDGFSPVEEEDSGSVVWRSFSLPGDLFESDFHPRGMCFLNGVLHVVTSSPVSTQ